MNRQRLLLCDSDGTMLTCRGKGVQAMHRVMQALWGVPAVTVRIEPQGKTDPMLFEEVGAAYGLAPHDVAARGLELQTLYAGALAEDLREPGACEVKTGVNALLDRLSSRSDVTLGIVSGNLEATAWLKLRAAGLDAYFGGGAFGSDSRRRADLVRLAVDRFAARTGFEFGPRDVWVIGDTPDDVAGGRAHGTWTLAVATGSFPRHALERCNPDALFDDFAHTAAVVDVLCGVR